MLALLLLQCGQLVKNELLHLSVDIDLTASLGSHRFEIKVVVGVGNMVFDWRDAIATRNKAVKATRETRLWQVIVVPRYELSFCLRSNERRLLLGALSLREVQVVEVLAQIVPIYHDLVDFAGEDWVHACALERVFEHPEQLLKVATCAC